MNGTALGRLLKYPHSAVFDGSPVAELAFRLQHQDGASWTVGDRVLRARAGDAVFSYDLRNFTVDQLRTQLTADGFDVLSASSRFAGMSALVLVEGGGDEYVSNGDHITGFTSPLWVILSGFAGEVLDAEDQVKQALLQMVITTAAGEWLDLWGTIYGIARWAAETDAHYAARIPQEAFRVRNNPRAIELAIRDATGFDVRIEEPWKNIFKLDGSKLSGSDQLYDGESTGYHLIKPVARTVIDWPAVRAVIDRNRAAGVLLLGPQLFHCSQLETGEFNVDACITSQHTRQQRVDDRVLLDYNLIEDVAILNHAAWWRREIMHSSILVVPSQSWNGFTWSGGGTWADTIYVVSSGHSRDYRVYYTSVEYSSNFWPVGDRTWGSAPAESWSSFNAIIHSLHVSES